MPFPLRPYAYTYDGLQVWYAGGSSEQINAAINFQTDVVTPFHPNGKQFYAIHVHSRYADPADGPDIRVSFVDPAVLPDVEGIDTTYGGDTTYTPGEKTIEIRLSEKIFDPDSPAPYNDVRWLYECLEHEWGHAITYLLMEHFGDDVIKRALSSYFNKSPAAWDAGPWRGRLVEAVAETYKDLALKPEWRIFSNRTKWRIVPGRQQAFLDLMTAYRIVHFHPNVLESGNYYLSARRIPDLFVNFVEFPAFAQSGALPPMAHIWSPNASDLPSPGTEFPFYGDWADATSSDYSFSVDWTTAAGDTIFSDSSLELTLDHPFPESPGNWMLRITVPDYDPADGLGFRLSGYGFLSNLVDLFHRVNPDGNGLVYDRIWWMPLGWGEDTVPRIYNVSVGHIRTGPPKRGHVRVEDIQIGHGDHLVDPTSRKTRGRPVVPQ